MVVAETAVVRRLVTCALMAGIGTAGTAWAAPVTRQIAYTGSAHGHGPTEPMPYAQITRQKPSQTPHVSFALRDSTIEFAVNAIAKQAHMRVFFSDASNPMLHKRIRVSVKDATIEAALAVILKGTELVGKMTSDGETIVIRDKPSSDTHDRAPDSTGVVTGHITDSATAKAVMGASISIAGTKLATTTSDNGDFTLNGVPAGPQIVTVKMFGYKPVSHTIHVTHGEQSSISVALAPTATQLTGVVTTATGVQRRLDVGNDVTTLDVDEIRKNAPVTTVTDILDGRVPDLIVTRGSGAPGSPSRIRVRGVGSINGNNDPIIIVDGTRIYSNQTTSQRDAQFSVLDNIDINTIDKIEVLKGPSASALYGSDAANGVIVITTKRGEAGTTRWTFSTDQTVTTQPQSFPGNAILEGVAPVGGLPQQCLVGSDPCFDTRLITYNPIADSRTTVLGTGHNQRYSGSVSGGSHTVRYFLSGQASTDHGLLKMSDADVAYLEQTTGKSVPDWQRRPQSSQQLGGTGTMTFLPLPSLTFNLTSAIDRNKRSSTPLDQALGIYESQTLPEDTSLVTGRIPNFRERTTWNELSFRNTVGSDWNPRSWLTLHGDGGLQTLSRDQNDLLRRGDCDNCAAFPNGKLIADRSTRSVSTLNFRGSVRLPERFGIRLTPSAGFNYVRTSIHDTELNAKDLALGSSSVAGAQTITVSDSGGTAIQAGVFLSTSIALFDQLTWSVGTRIDASNVLGANVTPTYPKLDLSYVVPIDHLLPSSAVSLLRLRMAYGHSAVQPDLGASLRTYQGEQGVFDNGVVGSVLDLATLGNPNLKPERSTEFEGGADMRFLLDRVTLSVTGYHKLSRDALVSLERPLSVGGGMVTTNLGSVRNSGGDVEVEALVLDRPDFRWNVNTTYSWNRNTLVRLAPAFNRAYVAAGGGSFLYGTRYVEGYPVNGIWMRPVAAYADANGDGFLTSSEIVRSDSSVFVGGPLPKYDASFGTQIGLWHDRMTIAATMQYQNGKSEVNQALVYNMILGTAKIAPLNDATTPLSEQAAYRSGYAAIHTVSTLRLQSLSVRWAAPAEIARRVFHTEAMSIALQGNNLGLWTNYAGSDPNVSDTILGNAVSDSGVLPQPRTWGINVSLNY